MPGDEADTAIKMDEGFEITRERRLEMALERLAGIADGCQQDLDRIKQSVPPSRRGSRFQAALDSLGGRVSALGEEAREALENGR